MPSSFIKFAQSSSSPSGIGAFNINLKSFIFQLVTFILVLLVFRRWVLPPILKTLEERRKTLEKSLEQAKETQETLAKAEVRAEEILAQARDQADEALAEAKRAASKVIADAESAADTRAGLIIKETDKQLGIERDKLRTELRAELADLVSEATEKIIHEKLDDRRDMSMIERAIKGITG